MKQVPAPPVFARATTFAVVACVVLVVPFSAAPVRAQTAAMDSAVQRCMAADTSTQWKAVAAAWAAHQGEPATNDALRRRLLELGRRDQAVRLVPGLLDSLKTPAFARRMMAADSANAAALMGIVAEYGWPTRSMVGTDGATAAFLIVQHNAGIQQAALRRMLALPAGEVNPSDLATLQDRILANAGKPQLYGTQLKLAAGDSALVFDSIADPAQLDRRRAAAGLPPLDVYICMVRGMYGHDVVDPRAAPNRKPPR